MSIAKNMKKHFNLFLNNRRKQIF